MNLNKDRLSVLGVLVPGQRLTSTNKLYSAILQDDGNFAVYKSSSKLLWSSKTYDILGSFHLILQADGNLVLYNPPIAGMNERAVWASGTNAKDLEDLELVMQNDGQLVLYANNGTQIWTTKSKDSVAELD